MHWDWKEVLQPMRLCIDPDMTVKEVFALLKKHDTEIAFVRQEGTIVGYVTKTTLLEEVMSGANKNQPIKHYEEDFLFVHETDMATYIHNCSVIIGADEQNEPTGYVIMSYLDYYLNNLQLKNFNNALNHAEMGFVMMDLSFQMIFMNEKAEQILGMDRTVLQGRDYRKVIRVEISLDKVLQGQTWYGIENTFNFKVISGQFSPIYENGVITGIIHNFYLKDQLQEVVHEIDFVREMNADLQAIYSLSNEQILMTDAQGIILRVAGAFFSHFWGEDNKEALIGRNVADFTSSGIFTPNIVTACIEKHDRVMLSQQGEASTVLSTATPIIENGEVKRVVIMSKDVTVDESIILHPDAQKPTDNEAIIYRSKEMAALMEEVKTVAPLDSTVLINGESGVGKEVIARRIHQLSHRASGNFVAINCGAIPEHLIESELFGHEKGAFTGASTSRIGLFEQGHDGTVFLDEISELPYGMQVKLLRVLQEREVIRVGSTMPIKINVRMIAATNKNLRKMVAEQTFREDLFYRLHVVPVRIPALRHRKEDIAALAIAFLADLNEKNGYDKEISTDALNLLESYQWPGNIRELRNTIERLIVTSRGLEITEKDVYRVLWETEIKEQGYLTIKGLMPLKQAVEETEKQLIELAIEKFGTATEAARALDVSISTVSRRMKRFEEAQQGVGGKQHDIF